MISARQFYENVRSHLRLHGGRPRHLFMHEEKERRLQNRFYSPQTMREVPYKGRAIAVQVFCDAATGKASLYVQVLSRSGGTSTNTQHVTLTNKNMNEGGFFVRPSLKRCASGRLRRPPRMVGAFPFPVVGTKNQYAVGPMGRQLLSRVFEVAIVKYDSLR